ncbi:LysM peptidoglycan-binding domain-containing protein [Dokdonella sp.]|uniref:LysM peptidoglycan-binding domain-containing protein n=1 Tax=Dokdonella sp. TaxID=2291710 RepID=UPI001B1C04BE|nr:LysM peptidoglycan-binding domain-containing protein [Dokdonella sp.]MBO9662952.1 LysM peptidoglycan-binding domain-containing protein [Dokdonella sp.]
MSIAPVSAVRYGSDALADQGQVHVAQRGDTLPTIAERFGVSTDDLAAANPEVVNPEVIYPDQVIRIPARADSARVVDAQPYPEPNDPAPPGAGGAVGGVVGSGVGGIGGGAGAPSASPGLHAARDRLRQLEANPPKREDFPGGFLGSFAYDFAKALHAGQVETAKVEVKYEQLKLDPPNEHDFPSKDAYDQARAEYQKQIASCVKTLGPLLVERYEAKSAQASPTAAKILAEAKRLGVPVTVLSDEEYQKRYPDTGGVTVGDHVYLPVSSLEDGTDTLEHESMHAILGRNGEIFDTSKSIDERVDKARALFQNMGLDPDDGERLVRVTDGWGQSASSDHVQTFVDSIDIGREKAGLPPLSPQQRDELYSLAAVREAALDVQRDPLDGIESKPPEEQKKLLAEAEAKWANTAQGRANPPSGDTFEERLASLQGILQRCADEGQFAKFTS